MDRLLFLIFILLFPPVYVRSQRSTLCISILMCINLATRKVTRRLLTHDNIVYRTFDPCHTWKLRNTGISKYISSMSCLWAFFTLIFFLDHYSMHQAAKLRHRSKFRLSPFSHVASRDTPFPRTTTNTLCHLDRPRLSYKKSLYRS